MFAHSDGQPSPHARTESSHGPTPGAGGVGGVCRAQEAIARLGGLPDLYADILGRLLDDKSGVHARLKEAVHQANANNIHSTAHNLKGLAMMCGAISVADVAAALEKAGRSGEDGEFLRLLNRLDAEMAAARIILAPYR